MKRGIIGKRTGLPYSLQTSISIFLFHVVLFSLLGN